MVEKNRFATMHSSFITPTGRIGRTRIGGAGGLVSATRGHLIERPNQRGIVKSKQQQLLYKLLGSTVLILPTTLCNIRLDMIVKGTVGWIVFM